MTDWINHPIKSSRWPTNHYLASDWQTKWLADRLTELFWLSNWLTVSLWETNWLTDRLTGWMTDWCTDWSINSGIDLTSVWEGEVGTLNHARWDIMTWPRIWSQNVRNPIFEEHCSFLHPPQLTDWPIDWLFDWFCQSNTKVINTKSKWITCHTLYSLISCDSSLNRRLAISSCCLATKSRNTVSSPSRPRIIFSTRRQKYQKIKIILTFRPQNIISLH